MKIDQMLIMEKIKEAENLPLTDPNRTLIIQHWYSEKEALVKALWLDATTFISRTKK